MRYSYEINEKVEVRIWDDENPNENGAPFQLQDVHPDGRPWADRAEAQAWVDAFIADLLAPAPEPTEE
jgi:hypothetical protein